MTQSAGSFIQNTWGKSWKSFSPANVMCKSYWHSSLQTCELPAGEIIIEATSEKWCSTKMLFKDVTKVASQIEKWSPKADGGSKAEGRKQQNISTYQNVHPLFQLENFRTCYPSLLPHSHTDKLHQVCAGSRMLHVRKTLGFKALIIAGVSWTSTWQQRRSI